jgi:TolB-like protein
LTPDRWRQVTAVFYAARARDLDGQRAYLDEACAGDASLRAEVESLLAAGSGSFGEAASTRAVLPSLSPGVMFGAYRVEGLLGVGGMGQVYRATDLRLRRPVALKLLIPELSQDAEFGSRFEREARVLASLNHPNIAAIHGLEEAEGVRALVLEFVDGQTLAERLARGPLPALEALTIARQIASALEAAHEHGIVHRDLKPANVKITPAGAVKVLDFGIAHSSAVSDGGAHTTAMATRPGLILGTPAYMSPEQARGLAVDKRTDIWAFGCVLFEMLTGDGAFAAGTASDSLARVIEREPDWSRLPPNLPESMDRLVRRCLQKDPADRLHDIADARIEISDALPTPSRAQQPAHVAPEPGAVAAAAAPSSAGLVLNWRVWLVVAVTVVGAIIAGGIWWSGRRVIPPDGALSVVALPAQVLGAQELGFLTDAIPNTLSTQLGQIEGLDTKVPPTSLEFEKIHHDLAVIADLYRVTTCIVSSITATDPEHFVLNVQLVEPRSGRILWAERYEGLRGSYLELARQAAEGIRQKLRPATSSVTAAAGQTANSEAELALREGTYFLTRFNNSHQSAHFDQAFSALQHALALDPKLADAAGQIALLHRLKWEASPTASATELIPEIERWANQALAISPRCSRAWAALFWAEIMRPTADRRKLVDYGLKAVTTGPQDSLAHNTLGAALVATSNELALQPMLESRRLDPLYVYSDFNASAVLMRLGRPGEALAMAEDGLRIEPEVAYGLRMKFSSLIGLRRRSDVLELIKQRPTAFDDPLSLYIVAVEQGATARADAALNRVVELVNNSQTSSNGRRQINSTLIPYLIEQGKTPLALQLLTRMTDVGDVPAYDWLRLERRFDAVRADARFEAVTVKSRAQLDQLRARLAEARTRAELPTYLEAALAKLAQ